MTRPDAVAGAGIGEPADTESPGGRLAAASGEFAAAVSFLTRLPIHRSTADLDRTGAAAFGLVGLAMGLVGAVPILAIGARLGLPAAIAALLLVVVISGGLHLDGLSDTADALVAPTPEAAERARSDPRAGPAGVTAIVLDLLLGGSFLAVLAARDPRVAAAAFVVALTASRAAAPVAALIVGRRSSQRLTGLGGWFSARVTTRDVGAAVLTIAVVTAGAAVLVGSAVALGAVAGLGVTALAGSAIMARRGRLDGDGYGAIVEITFVAILAGIAILLPAA